MSEVVSITPPDWAEAGYEISFNGTAVGEVYLKYVSLMPRHLYIAFKLLRVPTRAELRKMKKMARKVFKGEFVYAYIACDEEQNKRFARFFGLTETRAAENDALVYEGTF